MYARQLELGKALVFTLIAIPPFAFIATAKSIKQVKKLIKTLGHSSVIKNAWNYND